MDWVANRTYSFNSIVRALDNKRNKVKDNAHYSVLRADKVEKVLIIGGGNSVLEHQEAIKEYIHNNPDMPLLFVTARHAALYNEVVNKKYYCLVGNEAKRLSQNISGTDFKGECLLSPYPRTMGTEVPVYAESVHKNFRRYLLQIHTWIRVLQLLFRPPLNSRLIKFIS